MTSAFPMPVIQTAARPTGTLQKSGFKSVDSQIGSFKDKLAACQAPHDRTLNQGTAPRESPAEPRDKGPASQLPNEGQAQSSLAGDTQAPKEVQGRLQEAVDAFSEEKSPEDTPIMEEQALNEEQEINETSDEAAAPAQGLIRAPLLEVQPASDMVRTLNLQSVSGQDKAVLQADGGIGLAAGEPMESSEELWFSQIHQTAGIEPQNPDEPRFSPREPTGEKIGRDNQDETTVSNQANRALSGRTGEARPSGSNLALSFQETASDLSSGKENGQEKAGSSDIRKLIMTETQRLRGVSDQQSPHKSSAGQNQLVEPEMTMDGLKAQLESARSEPAVSKSEAKELMQQIVQKAEIMVKDKASSMILQLKPEFLGRLQIRLSVQDGVITARFSTENHQVKHILETGMGQLKAALESNGIRLERAEVNVDLGQSGSYQGFDQSRYRQERWNQVPSAFANGYLTDDEVNDLNDYYQTPFAAPPVYNDGGSLSFLV